jgi:hypothetical protein
MSTLRHGSSTEFHLTQVGQILRQTVEYVEQQRRPQPVTAERVAECVTQEVNGYVNASACLNSVEDEETGEHRLGSTVLVTVKDPTEGSGVKHFKITVEGWDI